MPSNPWKLGLRTGLQSRIQNPRITIWRNTVEQVLTPPEALPYVYQARLNARECQTPENISKAFDVLGTLLLSEGFLVLDHLMRVQPYAITEWSQRVFWYLLALVHQAMKATRPQQDPPTTIIELCRRSGYPLRESFSRMRAVSELRRKTSLGLDRRGERYTSRCRIYHNPDNLPDYPTAVKGSLYYQSANIQLLWCPPVPGHFESLHNIPKTSPPLLAQ